MLARRCRVRASLPDGAANLQLAGGLGVQQTPSLLGVGAPGRRGTARRQRAQMSAEADRPARLRRFADSVGPGTATTRLPERRVRLVQTRRQSGAGRDMGLIWSRARKSRVRRDEAGSANDEMTSNDQMTT